jgi:FAD:protein FMN transferase
MIQTPVALGDSRFFSHEAMKTTFTLRFVGVDEEDAKGVARECFERVDRLEDSLSRYREGGEIWRINHLKKGETLYLSDACHRCLLKAWEAHQATGGLFDITIGSKIQHGKEGQGIPMCPP